MRNSTRVKIVLCLAAAAFLAGCAGKAPWYGSETEGFILQYRFPEAETLRYSGVFDMSVTMERGDTQMEIASTADATFALKGKSTEPSTGIQTKILWICP